MTGPLHSDISFGLVLFQKDITTGEFTCGFFHGFPTRSFCISEPVQSPINGGHVQVIEHAMSPGIPAGTCKSTCGKPVKTLDPEGSGLMNPSPGQIQVTPLRK